MPHHHHWHHSVYTVALAVVRLFHTSSFSHPLKQISCWFVHQSASLVLCTTNFESYAIITSRTFAVNHILRRQADCLDMRGRRETATGKESKEEHSLEGKWGLKKTTGWGEIMLLCRHCFLCERISKRTEEKVDICFKWGESKSSCTSLRKWGPCLPDSAGRGGRRWMATVKWQKARHSNEVCRWRGGRSWADDG